jgi:hypothetical protein
LESSPKGTCNNGAARLVPRPAPACYAPRWLPMRRGV